MNNRDRKHSSIDLLLALTTEPAVEFQSWRPHSSEKADDATGPAITPDLNDAELRFLRAVLAHPGKPSSAYAKLSRLGTHQAIKTRQRLISEGYLREHRVNTSARGRASVVLAPSSKAIKVIAEGSK